MSGTHFSISRSSLVVIVFIAANSFPAAALRSQGTVNRDADALDQIKRQNEVAAQKTEFDVRAAVRQAERLALSDPARAVEQLKTVLSRLEDDAILSEKRRETLKRLLKDRIRVTAAMMEDAGRQTRVAAHSRAEADQRRTSQDSILQLREEL
jgi:hypothetical protein